MARTIKQIQVAITAELEAKQPSLSTSAVAEWRLWTWVVATAIYSFEVILDLFRAEMDDVADKITPGTVRWYAEMCRRFQNGHELLFDDNTAQLYYKDDDPAARVVSVVAITERAMHLSVKVAKIDSANKVVPLSVDELYNFAGYIDVIKFAGVETTVISTTADALRYNIDIYFDPAVPATAVRAGVEDALEKFRSSLDFNSRLYRQRLVDAVMSVKGVVTAELRALDRKGASMTDFAAVGVVEELESGYFDYDAQSILTLSSTSSL